VAQDKFIQRGAASLSVDTTGPARVFHFLLLPKLTMLAFSAAVEPLRIANQLAQKTLYEWYTVSAHGAPVTCSNGITITPDMGLGDLPKGATVFVCSGVEPHKSASPDVVGWLRRHHRMGVRMGGICTGAFALAQAGIIGKNRFTLHWENQPAFTESHPDFVPTQNLYEIEERLITCGGGNAATDMMLDLIEADHGPQMALVVADMCIHKRSNDRQAPQKSSLSVAIGSRNQKLLQAIQVMTQTVEEPLPLLDLCETLDISRRQLERLFKKYTHQSPTQFYYGLRLERAHALLNETNMTITEIAAATGFNSTSHLARQFRTKYGVSPNSFRKAWSD
jgi:AraC family carnitine catabolism transcriptional activator